MVSDAVRSPWRPPVAISLGTHLVGSLLPHADPSDAATLCAGVKARLGKKMPILDDKFLLGLRKYTENWIKQRNLDKLHWDFDSSLDTWLDKTNYPLWRKNELREHSEKILNLLERNKYKELMHFTIKLFMKDEHYIDFKHARGIYARDDAAKIAFGPWFKGIEEIIYSQPEFIKHVPVSDRAKYIYDMLYVPGSCYVATDYSSFEAHFTQKLMENCEFVLYEYMLKDSNGGPEMLDLMREVLMGKNRIYNKFVRATCLARRMSGEMNTSLGNGFSNLMFMGYVCQEMGIDKVNGVVEGDDGLFQFMGKAPTTEDFSKYGFLIKLDKYDKISQASFCGNLFDEEDKQVVTDPFDILSSFGWTTYKYRNANQKKCRTLLRCKALSMAHQYPGCPIIGSLAQYVLRCTRGRTKKDMISFIENRKDINMWDREKYLRILNDFEKDEDLYRSPGISTRLFFEEQYGINVSVQLKVEDYLNSLHEIQPLEIPLILDLVPDSWKCYFEKFVQEFDIVPNNILFQHSIAA